MLFFKQRLFHAAAVIVVSFILRAKGISFLAVFPRDNNSTGTTPILHIALGNDVMAYVTITRPNNLHLLNVTVTLNIHSVVHESIRLDSNIIPQASQKYENIGILIESVGDITVLAENQRKWTEAGLGLSEASFLLTPVRSLGTSYVTVTTCLDHNCVIVVGCPYNDTMVAIELVAIQNDVPGSITYNDKVYNHGDELAEILNAYDSLQLLGFKVDMTGTFVRSTRPVAVLSGGEFDKLENSRKDALIEQIPPLEALGTTYFISGFQTLTAYGALIVFTDGDTHIDFQPIGDVEIIKEDSYKQYVKINNSHTGVEVTSNRPVLVVLRAPVEQDTVPMPDNEQDLSMVQIRPFSRWEQFYQAPLFRRASVTENYLDIITFSNCSSDFLLNGVILQGIGWRFSVQLKTALINLSSINGSFNISNPDCAFGGYVSGIDDNNAWAFSLAPEGLTTQLCPCSCMSNMSWIDSLTLEEKDNMRNAIAKNLQVDVQTLSSTVRRKTSADNKKAVSSYIGFAVTVVMLTSVFSFIVLGDILSIVSFSATRGNCS